MVTTLKVRKIGNSLGVILPSELLEALQVGEGDKVFLVKESEGLRLASYDPDIEKAMRIYERGRNQYRNALRALARGSDEDKPTPVNTTE